MNLGSAFRQENNWPVFSSAPTKPLSMQTIPVNPSQSRETPQREASQFGVTIGLLPFAPYKMASILVFDILPPLLILSSKKMPHLLKVGLCDYGPSRGL